MGKSKRKSADVSSEEKKETDPKQIFISDELTRKPLKDFRGPKEPELYPEKAELQGNLEIEQHGVNKEEDFSYDEEEEETTITDEDQTYTYRKVIRRGKFKSSKTKDSNPTQKQSQLEKQFPSIKIMLVIAIIGLIVFIIFPICFLYNNHAIHSNTPILDFDAIVSKLKPEFRHQPDMSFRIIRSALKAVNKTEPTAPAIIVLLASKGAERLSLHLGRKLVEAVSETPLTISGMEYKGLDYDAGKKKIDDQLRTLSKDKYEAVIIEDLHLISGGTALMFHSFWDHENAPYKRVIFVMTVTSESPISFESSNKYWDETVNNQLAISWSDIKEDQRSPLVARATVGVAAITADNK